APRYLSLETRTAATPDPSAGATRSLRDGCATGGIARMGYPPPRPHGRGAGVVGGASGVGRAPRVRPPGAGRARAAPPPPPLAPRRRGGRHRRRDRAPRAAVAARPL